MPTVPREWPNNAREVRDRASEEAVRALRALQPLLERSTTQEELIRRIAIALDATQTIARLLESVGAPTRPN